MLLTVGSCLLTMASAALLPSVADAAEANGYGELARFGEAGDKAAGEAIEPGKLAERRTRLLGVDPTDNSVYVLDEPKSPTIGSNKIERHFRLQKFSAPPNKKYAVVASALFSETSPDATEEKTPEVESFAAQAAGVEGITVEPAWEEGGVKHESRVYVLTVDDRARTLHVDNHVPGERNDSAASTLYAFSTAQHGEELVPAQGTKAGGIVIGPDELGAQSEVPGQALLEPRGITVDPAKHEVIVLGHIDEKGEEEDSIASPSDHYALQRITAAGSLGARYVDSTDFLKQGTQDTPPESPVVATTTTGGTSVEHVDVAHRESNSGEDIAEVPSNFASTEAAKTVAKQPASGLTQGALTGPLTATANGTIFGLGKIIEDKPQVEPVEPETEEAFADLVGLSAATGSEIGWTGGQQAEHSGGTDKCVIEPVVFGANGVIELPEGESVQVAAGSEGKLFVLQPEFLIRNELELEEEEENEEGNGKFKKIYTPISGPFFPAVIELGPGGTGCAEAAASVPKAEVATKVIKSGESVPQGTEVSFSSQVRQADALSVEWEFTNGAIKEEQTVPADEGQVTSVTHKFSGAPGTYEVTERIQSDDLAAAGQSVFKAGQLTSPTISQTSTIDIGSAPPPTAAFTSSASTTVSKMMTFNATSSHAPPGSTITKYKWSFGDGTSEETTKPEVSHQYKEVTSYKVELTVIDSFGVASVPFPQTIKTSEVKSEPPPVKTEPPPVKTEETKSSGGGSPAPPPPPSPGSGGVLSYQIGLAAVSLTVSSSGAVAVTVNCQGQSSCSGTLTLRTLSAVSAGKHKKAILTLASGSFAISGGQVKALTLHLSAKARALLAQAHSLRARAMIVARDSSGAPHTTLSVVTLRPAKAKHHH